MDYGNNRTRKRKGKNTFFFFFLTTIILVISLIIFSQISSPKKQTNQVLSIQSTPTPESPTPTQSFFNSQALEEIVQNSLEGTKGNYAVYIKKLKNNETYALNANKEFAPGSLYKLWVMATVYQQISQNKLTENQILTQKIEVLNKKFQISSESAELTKGNITQSVKDALFKMITISDNYSALLLSEKIRLTTISNFLKDFGFNNSLVSTNGQGPSTTAMDIGLFFEKLHNGELNTPENTSKMLSILKSQRLNQKIPKYLPKNIQIAHKTGELDTYTHDAGIVYAPNGEYILVVLTDSQNPAQAQERISEISKNVYKYLVLE